MAAGVAAATLAGVSGADTADPVWNCRASAAYVEQDLIPNPGIERVEPIMANGNASQSAPDRAHCVDDAGGVPHIDVPDASSPLVVADAAYARTEIEPNIGAARDQGVKSTAGVKKAQIILAGNEVLEVRTINVSATASCASGVPKFDGATEVVGIELGGVPIPVEGVLPNVIELPGVATIKLNQKLPFGSAASGTQGLIVRGVQVEVLPVGNEPLANVVVGEAKVSRSNAVCAPPTPPPTVVETTTVTTPGTTTTVVETTTQTETVTTPGQTETVTTPGQTTTTPGATQTQTVTTPGQTTTVAGGGPDTSPFLPGNGGNGGGSGGVETVGAASVNLSDVKGISKSNPCRNKRFGSQMALVGTSGRDRVTGSNRSDRIFTFGGKDNVSGGRGNDCMDGGRGNDALSGSNGSDYLIGGAGHDGLYGADGRDVLDGGPGNDYLSGGSHPDTMRGGTGHDTINAGGNNDKVYAGPGNDKINAATAGYRQFVDCGSGRDVVRLQKYDRSRNCERVIIVG